MAKENGRSRTPRRGSGAEEGGVRGGVRARGVTGATTAGARGAAPAAAAAGGEKGVEERNPRTDEYHFGGPLGALAMLVCLPVVIVALTVWIKSGRWPAVSETVSFLTSGGHVGRHDLVLRAALFSWEAHAVVLGWWWLHALLHVAVPWSVELGRPLRDGSRLAYPVNGLACGALAVSAAWLGHWAGWYDVTWMAQEAVVVDEEGKEVFRFENIGKLAVAATVWSTLMAVWLYARARAADPEKVVLSVVGNSGNVLYDFVLGHELNPRVPVFAGFDFDLKYFNELRPGITGWAMINLAYALHAYRTLSNTVAATAASSTSSPLVLPPEFVLLLAFQLWYAYDALACEASILTTVDIVTDGFGWMLCFGDLVWVPFVFSLQARFLAAHPLHLGWLHVAGVAAVALLGAFIFRSSNSQKDTFRKNPDHPDVRDLLYIPTRRGTRLLADGWWGVARHVNYLGDWLLGLSWCLTTGFSSLFTYVYVIYFAALLVHRERRDDAECLAKYGDDWREYRRRVPSRIIPYVY